MAAVVSEMTLRTDGLGITVELSVKRVPEQTRFLDAPPRLEDMPQDIADALRKWLTP